MSGFPLHFRLFHLCFTIFAFPLSTPRLEVAAGLLIEVFFFPLPSSLSATFRDDGIDGRWSPLFPPISSPSFDNHISLLSFFFFRDILRGSPADFECG